MNTFHVAECLYWHRRYSNQYYTSQYTRITFIFRFSSFCGTRRHLNTKQITATVLPQLDSITNTSISRLLSSISVFSVMPSNLVSKLAPHMGQHLVRCSTFHRTGMASHRSSITLFSSTGDNQEWRKEQLDRLRRKFESEKDIPVIDDDEDLQPMWREMESRVTKRRSVTVAEAGGRVGRSNIRRTDEEAWLQAGMYDQDDEKAKGKDDQGKE